jgi:hypothetical protein
MDSLIIISNTAVHTLLMLFSEQIQKLATQDLSFKSSSLAHQVVEACFKKTAFSLTLIKNQLNLRSYRQKAMDFFSLMERERKGKSKKFSLQRRYIKQKCA